MITSPAVSQYAPSDGELRGRQPSLVRSHAPPSHGERDVEFRLRRTAKQGGGSGRPVVYDSHIPRQIRTIGN